MREMLGEVMRNHRPQLIPNLLIVGRMFGRKSADPHQQRFAQQTQTLRKRRMARHQLLRPKDQQITRQAFRRPSQRVPFRFGKKLSETFRHLQRQRLCLLSIIQHTKNTLQKGFRILRCQREFFDQREILWPRHHRVKHRQRCPQTAKIRVTFQQEIKRSKKHMWIRRTQDIFRIRGLVDWKMVVHNASIGWDEGQAFHQRACPVRRHRRHRRHRRPQQRSHIGKVCPYLSPIPLLPTRQVVISMGLTLTEGFVLIVAVLVKQTTSTESPRKGLTSRPSRKPLVLAVVSSRHKPPSGLDLLCAPPWNPNHERSRIDDFARRIHAPSQRRNPL